MSDLVQTIAKVRAMAVEAETPIEQFMRTAEVIAKQQNEENDARRSSNAEREAIDAYLKTLDGNINPDMPPSDIAAKAGEKMGIKVRSNQGTSQYASRAKKRLLLTYNIRPTA